MFLKTIDSQGDRWLWWPIRLRWAPEGSSLWFKSHGWEVGSERCAVSETGGRCMPGFRSVIGRTLHFGRLKVCMGGGWRGRAESGGEVQSPPRAAATHSKKNVPPQGPDVRFVKEGW
jgi:hypothetical protein